MKYSNKTTGGRRVKKSGSTGVDPLFLTSVLLAIIVTIYLGRSISVSTYEVLSVSLLALIGGLLFESLRISDNWISFFYIFIVSLFLSLSAFLPGKSGQNYDFDKNLAMWPYIFLLIFIVLSTVFHSDKVTAKLTEGITLLQSISIVYWMLDQGLWDINNWFVKFFIVSSSLFSLFAVGNALTNFTLSSATRLALSIWSCIIMLLLALDNMLSMYQYRAINSTNYTSQDLFIGMQFFLLGVSCMYVAQNLFLLMGFLPGRGSLFNASYFDELIEVKRTHIERYSDRQVDIGHSIICIVVVTSVYWLNYTYNYLPCRTIIWASFVFFPLLIDWTSKLKRINITTRNSRSGSV